MEGRALTSIQEAPIEVEGALGFLGDPAAGAQVIFLGTVRDNGEAEGKVESILYECHLPLAKKRLERLAQETLEAFDIQKVALIHRYGMLKVGETSVLVAASAPHRVQAFEAARHGIERIKHTLPVWKKELLADEASRWVKGVPLDSI
jgi:molybdopterin synthase catalytic subunit